jgi:hypothetical protein
MGRRHMSKPNVYVGSSDGTSPLDLPISGQYFDNAITITGLAVGIITVRAKASENPVFEDVLNGEIRLDKSRTLTIRKTQLDALEFTVDPEAAYTVRVKQTDGDTER